MEQNQTSYYIRQMSRMMRGFETMYRCSSPSISRFADPADMEVIYESARTEYISLIPQIPYIGGKQNPHTANLVGCAQLLAIIRSLEKHGLTYVQIGEVIYRTWEQYVARIPKWAGKVAGKIMFSRRSMEKRRKAAEESQARLYPEAFVSECVSCTDGSFDFGLDTVECAVVKFYAAQGASRYVRYICLGDYPMFRRLGVGFTRTKTLGNGDDRCDFRWTTAGTTPAGWPPETLPEWKQD